jgi:hypothetical protein
MNLPWISLFDGVSLKNWKIINRTEGVAIQNNTLICHMVANTSEHSFVCTEEKFSDFILEMDCKLEGDFHTGILFRCIDAPVDAKVRLYGYQVKIDPTPRKWTGGIFDDFGDCWKWLYDLSQDERAREAFKMNQWNTFRIEAIGAQSKVWINNIPVCNMIHEKYAHGYIALKMHSLNDNPEKEKVLVHFKNIRIITENPEKYLQNMDIPAIAVADTD